MPLITAPVSAQTGAIVRVRVSLDQPSIVSLRRAAKAVPQSVTVDALLDTGAECCCIDPAVVTRAGLPLYSFGFAAAPAVGSPQVSALGGTTVGTYHLAGLAIVHPAQQADLIVPKVVVQSLSLAAFGIGAVIGRDVLARCLLVYDGPGGGATLAY